MKMELKNKHMMLPADTAQTCKRKLILISTDTVGVKSLIHQSELGTYTKVVPFQEKSSFHFVVLCKLLNGMD